MFIIIMNNHYHHDFTNYVLRGEHYVIGILLKYMDPSRWYSHIVHVRGLDVWQLFETWSENIYFLYLQMRNDNSLSRILHPYLYITYFEFCYYNRSYKKKCTLIHSCLVSVAISIHKEVVRESSHGGPATEGGPSWICEQRSGQVRLSRPPSAPVLWFLWQVVYWKVMTFNNLGISSYMYIFI